MAAIGSILRVLVTVGLMALAGFLFYYLYALGTAIPTPNYPKGTLSSVQTAPANPAPVMEPVPVVEPAAVVEPAPAPVVEVDPAPAADPAPAP